jgi:hypothetical protein
MITKYLSYLISPYGVALILFIIGARREDILLVVLSVVLFWSCIVHEALKQWRKEEDEKDRAWREKQKNDKG